MDAHELLSQDRVRMDAAWCDPSLLTLFDRGAKRLEDFGQRRGGRILVDASFLVDAHTTTCLAAAATRLTNRERKDLNAVLETTLPSFRAR